jgi:DNA-binding transcriptional LysR family regulator
LRVLLAVQRAGSLAKAAKDLGVDKATVGRRLRALGNALGVQLVERVANGYRLSAQSNAAVDAAAQIDAVVSELEARTGSEEGAVRVTAPVWFARHVLIPATARFRELHPTVQVNLLTTNQLLDLGKREADVAVRNVRPTQQSFVVRRAGVLGSALYASAAYLAARGTPATREALRGHHVIAYADRITYSPGLTWLESAGLHVAFRATDTVTLHDAARAGIGLAALPCYVGDADKELERLPAFGVDQDEIWVVSHADSRASPRIRAVSQWIIDLFAEHASKLSGGEPAPARRERRRAPRK